MPVLSFKVMLCEQRPYGHPSVALAQGTKELRAILTLLNPKHVEYRTEESSPFLVALGAGLGPVRRPKDTFRPTVVGIVCSTAEWRHAQRAMEDQLLRQLPKNVFLVFYCVDDDTEKLTVANSKQYKVFQPQDLVGKRGEFKAGLRKWRAELPLPV